MNELLQNPLIQSAVLPFTVSLVIAVILRPHGWYWAGLSAVIGLVATVYLLTDFKFFPLRSHLKILLLGGGAVLLGVLLDLIPWRRIVPVVLVVASIAAALWVVWPRFRVLDSWQLWTLAVAGPLYVAWMVAASEGLRQKSFQTDSLVFALSLGTGISAVLGATALYGQLASAISAAVGARLLLHFFGKPVPAGLIMLVPLVGISALLGLGAVVYAKLPWYSLLVLALIPVLVRVPIPASFPRFMQMVLIVVCGLFPALLAIFLTWREAGAPPI